MFMSALFDYRIMADGIYIMLFHALPLRVCAVDQITGVEITSNWFTWYPPFQTLRLGNRISRGFLVIHKRGFFKILLLTPRDPLAFRLEIENLLPHTGVTAA